MKYRSIFVVALLVAVTPFVAAAQRLQATRATNEIAPPLHTIPVETPVQGDETLFGLLAVKPEIPLGPLDVLREYEGEMTLIAQRMSAEMAGISQGLRTKQITRQQAEYLIRERYQVAMMQHEVLSTLHDCLEHDLAQAAAGPEHPGSASESDTTVVAQPPSSWQDRTH